MNSLRRQRSHTTSETDPTSNKDRSKFRHSLSREPTLPSGKSWMKFFGNHPSKQISSENIDHSLELDITYLTPRLIVMTTIRENPSNSSSSSIVDSIENFFDTKYPDHYTIYTLDHSSNEQLSQNKQFFHNKVVDLPLFDGQQSPRLIVLLWFCQKISSYLLQSPLNVVVLHSIDEINPMAFGSCSLLAYHRIFPRVDQILRYYQSKRCAYLFFTMSQKRYIQYLCDLSFDVIEPPHFNPLIIKEIQLTPVPLVNRQKTGCRPFVDIYDQDQKKIFSTYDQIPKLKVYSSADSHCLIPINLSFNGDVTIHLNHAAIGHARQTHEGGIRIGELTINSNFSTVNHPNLFYSRNELDQIDLNDKNPTQFRLTIEFIHSAKENFEHEDFFTEQLNKTFKQPFVLFQDEQQLQKAIDDNDHQQENHEDLSSVIHRRRKSKDGSISSISTSPTSPSIHLNRTSFAFSNPIQSFVNPRHTFSHQIESTDRVLSELFSSSSLIEENPTNDVSLLDFQEDLLSDKPKEEEEEEVHSPPSPIPVIIEEKSSTTNSTEKPKIDIYQYFIGVDGLGKDPKQPSIPTTIGAARKAALAKDIDPVVLKVREWREGKKGNLRALLCSLSNITWPECTWNGCQMHELVTDEQVKKIYRKAVLHIHPDKLRNDPNEELAKLIFMELNQAWSLFEEQSSI